MNKSMNELDADRLRILAQHAAKGVFDLAESEAPLDRDAYWERLYKLVSTKVPAAAERPFYLFPEETVQVERGKHGLTITAYKDHWSVIYYANDVTKLHTTVREALEELRSKDADCSSS